jgi:hypothetical protein
MRAFQKLLGVFLRQKLQKALGADAHPAAEQALKMMLAEMNAGSDLRQTRLLAEVFFNE